MKISVSLPDEDVEFLDAYAETQGFRSRSAALHRTVRLLRGAELGAAYEDAFVEWEAGTDTTDWEGTAADGLGTHAPR